MIGSSELKKLEEEMLLDATLPLTTNLVFGEGDPEAKVVFVGEAPGATEDKLQRPFVGRAGKLLDQLIEGLGWKRDGVYITNIVKRRPPENRDPLPEEIGAYRPYLEKELSIINPPIIVPLGRFSMSYFIPQGMISRDQGKVFLVNNRFVMPVYHPAAALRNPNLIKDLEIAFAKIPKLIEKYPEVIREKRKGSVPKPKSQHELFS